MIDFLTRKNRFIKNIFKITSTRVSEATNETNKTLLFTQGYKDSKIKIGLYEMYSIYLDIVLFEFFFLIVLRCHDSKILSPEVHATF